MLNFLNNFTFFELIYLKYDSYLVDIKLSICKIYYVTYKFEKVYFGAKILSHS